MLTTRYVPGSPIWMDISTPDLDAAARFYREVFGWTHVPGGPEVGGYGLFQLDGKTVAGGMTIPADQAPTSWNLYFQTPDADGTAATVRTGGGTVVAEPMDVMDLGRMAVFADPQGAFFAVWQPGTNKGLDLVNAPGALFWTELNTADVPAALAFYSAVFGWGTTTMPMPGGDGAAYTMIHPEGQSPEEMFGGIAPLGDGGPLHRSSWLPYFLTEDCDATAAKARDAGGTISLEPVDMPGVGRFAMVDDTTGARFFLMTPSPRDS
ncbi:VOC family protein [Streptomyces sp. NPDC058953]|uniref:VOC family protein n=1 Tax=unclassified Streptomyces TaxID=2593676 RepID=UPI00367FB597